ncbi:MAG: hypothetical protein K6T81_06445 [Alicyclobacillus macrosporangiidus]|uniref:GDSL-type esterase/lipase family protein n=1 Tax=Alicyclobacillus macrosporangiidus TaxID=392015 RepID=UPI0026EF6F2B|nr:GDSL-type esterase/lipase family protein [Alicyclobacillus macrosporangiidus]MCL6598366.1 hypothetical protein [Alicyclobacillus macrosporangiidus]
MRTREDKRWRGQRIAAVSTILAALLGGPAQPVFAATALAHPASAGSAPSSAPAHAKDGTGRALAPGQRLVALGDSIPFGYGLPGAEASPGARTLADLHPAPGAYPLLVARDNGARVTDLAVPGWTSSDLLNALGTPPFQQALRTANVVTVEIGSNDLLNAVPDLAQAAAGGTVHVDPARVQTGIRQLSANLPRILAAVRKQTSAPVILFNLYDPFPATAPLHGEAEAAIRAANDAIAATAAQAAVPVVDAYRVMDGRQEDLIRIQARDIHPNAAGQRALAQALEAVLMRPLWYTPAYFVTAPKGALIYSRPAAGPFAIWWLHGDAALWVTGMNGDWLQVVTPLGQTGYVRRDQVSASVRWPWGSRG